MEDIIHICLRVSSALTNTMTKKPVGEKRFISLTLQPCCSSLKGFGDRNSKQGRIPKAGVDAEAMEEAVYWMLPTDCSAHLPVQIRTNNPGMAPCISGLPASVDYLMRKCHIPGSKGDIFPDEAPSYDNFTLCQADIHNIQNNINNRI